MVRFRYMVLVFGLCHGQQVSAQNYSLSGVVTDFDDRPLASASALILENGFGATTNEQGLFSISLPKGVYTLQVTHVGMEAFVRKVPVFREVDLILKLLPAVIEMEEFVMSARPQDYRIQAAPGIERLSFSDLEDVPFLMGEKDVINAIVSLPGVSTIGEGAGGFNVRGGKIDQNLVILNGAEIFNSSHLLGFFSIFNSDVVEDFTLYKGHLPAIFGGRTASVLKVNLKEGDYQQWDGSITAGFATGKAYLEGPIIPDKLSIIASARQAYPNWLLRRVDNIEVRRSAAGFNDQNLTLGYRINDQNKVRLSIYRSADKFRFSDDFQFGWQHLMGGLNMRSALSDHFFNELALNVVRFNNEQLDLASDLALSKGIETITISDNITWDGMDLHEFQAGIEWKHYAQSPEESSSGADSGFVGSMVTKDKGWVFSTYLQDDWQPFTGLTISAGLRYNHYQQSGRGNVYTYLPGMERSVLNIADTLRPKNAYARYDNVEPRVGLNYKIGPQMALKASLNNVNQFIHLVSNTTTATPVDQWQLSTRYLEPQRSWNYSAGLTFQGSKKIWQHSLDLFYRDIQNLYDFKDFAQLLLNDHLETELLSGKGKAYGFEVLVEKLKFGWTGWLAYTYSRSLNRVVGALASETINEGRWYPSNYDQPHSISLIMSRDVGHNGFISFNFNYNQGRPFTKVLSNYMVNGIIVPRFSDRNSARIPDYVRLDVSLGLKSIVRGWQDKFTISLYNVFSRRNAYSIYYRRPSDVAIVPFSYKLSVLGRFFPSVTYTVHFRRRHK